MKELSKDIVEALLTHQRPMSRMELVGALQTTIRRLAPALDALVEEGHLLRLVERVGTLDVGLRIGVEQTTYWIAPPRLLTPPARDPDEGA